MALLFGIYPGGLSGAPDGSVTDGPAEDPGHITAALDTLHGEHPFLVRGYLHYSDAAPGIVHAPPDPSRYATGNRRLDLVLCFREPGHDLTGWLEFVRAQVRLHAGRLATLQITEEANHSGPGGDGGFPAVRQALVEGVIAAKREAADVRIGCKHFRHRSLAAAGIAPTVPIHITEHGWGTGADRPYSRQAEVLETVVRTIDDDSDDLNITTYQHFALRDANSAHEHPLFQLGLFDSGYRPKPAAATYRRLISELSQTP